jgi:hypothetical protein
MDTLFLFSDNPLCPINVYKEYRSRRSPEALLPEARMYLTPLRKERAGIWYSLQPMGKNTVATICKRMFTAAGISGEFISAKNHFNRPRLVL